MKQTAVEWLAKELLREHPALTNHDAIQQAKEMEKQQIQDAYRISPNNELWSNSGIDYYEKTFKTK
jgi:hypothetical protein